MNDPTTSDAADGFAARVQQMHVPEPKADREALLLRVGGALVVVGLILVFAGYWGASGTASVAEQVPYAISGGAGGLGLVVVGAALITRFSLARLFRFWLARVVYEHQTQTDRTVDALGRIEAVLSGNAPEAPAPAPAPAAAPAPAPAPAAPAPASTGSSAGASPRRRKEPLRAEPLDS